MLVSLLYLRVIALSVNRAILDLFPWNLKLNDNEGGGDLFELLAAGWIFSIWYFGSSLPGDSAGLVEVATFSLSYCIATTASAIGIGVLSLTVQSLRKRAWPGPDRFRNQEYQPRPKESAAIALILTAIIIESILATIAFFDPSAIMQGILPGSALP